MSGIEVKAFNSKGIAAVREFLAISRSGLIAPSPVELLDDKSLVDGSYRDVIIESRRFSTRRQAADYFHEKFAHVSPNILRKDAGLWTWLSLFYFDQVCPEQAGQRTVRNDYTYVFIPDDSRYFYRHLLFIGWYAKNVSPTYNRLFLDTSLHQLDKYTSEVFKRLYLTRIRCLFEVLDRIYWDQALGGPRKRMVSPGKIISGDLMHRFPIRIRQLEKTYDLLSLDADHLFELLGDEFRQLVSPA